ncbi:MAG: hypothetical protein AAF514_04030 [Verrucomicrobiota bacterium]
MNPTYRLLLLRWTLCAGFFAGIFLSLNLWLTHRTYPHVPFFESLPHPPQALSLILLAALILSLALIALETFGRKPLFVFLALIALLIVLDQNRLQPWIYQYTLGLLPFVWLKGKAPSEDRIHGVLNGARLFTIGSYLWSGLHKLSPAFRELWQDSLVTPWLKDSSLKPLALATTSWIGPLEILIALALLVPRLRNTAVLLATSTHLFILLMVGPLGLNFNMVIWPWNICLIALVWILFWKTPDLQWPSLTKSSIAIPVAVIGILALILPSFSLGHKWDRYLSFHLYSGQQQRLLIGFAPSAVRKLPENLTPFLTPSPWPEYQQLAPDNWAPKDMGVPPVTENRVLIKVCQEVLTRRRNDKTTAFRDDEIIIYRDYPHLLEERGWATYKPSEIRTWSRFPPLKK